LGRGLTAADMPVIRSIVRQARAEDYRFSSLMSGIIHSAPFEMRTAWDPDAQELGGSSTLEGASDVRH